MSEKDPTEPNTGNEYPDELLAEHTQMRERLKQGLIEKGIPEPQAENILKSDFDTLSIFRNLAVDPEEFIQKHAERNSSTQQENLPDMPKNSPAMQEFRAKVKRKLLEKNYAEADIEKLLNERFDDEKKTFKKIDSSDTWVHNLGKELDEISYQRQQQELMRLKKKEDLPVSKKILSTKKASPILNSKEAVSNSGVPTADSFAELIDRPEAISQSLFRELAQTEEGRSALLEAVAIREKVLLELRKQYGISKKSELDELELQNEIEGWSLYEAKTKLLKEHLPHVHKFGTTVLNDTWWPEWQRFFVASTELTRTLGLHGRENNLDEKKAIMETAWRHSKPRKVSVKSTPVVRPKVPPSPASLVRPTDTLDLESMEGALGDVGSGVSSVEIPVSKIDPISSSAPVASSLTPPAAPPSPLATPTAPPAPVAPTDPLDAFGPKINEPIKDLGNPLGDYHAEVAEEAEERYRQTIKEALSDAYLKMVADITNSSGGYAGAMEVPELNEFSALKNEIESLLEKRDDFGPVEHTLEEKKEIESKLQKLTELQKEVYRTFGLELRSDAPEERDTPQLSEWREKRNVWRALKSEYEAKLGEYYKNREDRTLLQKIRGIGKEPPPELEELETRYKASRKEYATSLRDALKARKEARESGDTKTEWSFEHAGIKEDAANRFIFKEIQDKLELQKAALKSEDEARFARFKKAVTAFQEIPRWKKILGAAGIGAAVTLASGGTVSAAGLLTRLVGMVVGTGVGTAVGMGAAKAVERHYEPKIQRAAQDLGEEEAAARTEFSVDTIDERGEIIEEGRQRVTELEARKKRNATIAGVGAAATAGYLTGRGADSIADMLNPTSTIENGGQAPSLPVEKGVPDADSRGLTRPGSEVPVIDGSADSAKAESVPAARSVGEYMVQKGDSLWNILEGKGPDNNPVGGTSKFLEDMPRQPRQFALNQLVAYMESNPEFTKSVGIESGDPHKIFPGDAIKTSLIDVKMSELLQGDPRFAEYSARLASFDASSPQAVQTAGLQMTGFENSPELQGRNSLSSTSETEIARGEGNGFGLAALALGATGFGAAAAAPRAEKGRRIEPVLSATPRPAESIPATTSPSAERVEPTLGAPAEPIAVAPTVETTAPITEGTQRLVDALVAKVEAPRKAFFGLVNMREDIEGSVKTIGDLTVREIIRLQEAGTPEEFKSKGVTKSGIEAWYDEIYRRYNTVPALLDETLNQFLVRVVTTDTADKPKT